MTQLTGPIAVTGQDILLDSSVQNATLGVYAETNDGRGFRYCKIGAVSTVPGKLYCSAAQDTTNLNPSGGLAVAAAAIGTTAVTLTGSLTLAANLIAGGLMSVTVTPGHGYTYRVKGNSAVSAAANCAVTLEDPLIVALTTSSKVLFMQNKYANVIVSPASVSGAPVGVAIGIITNANFGWLQVRGPVGLLNDTGTGVGKAVMPSATVAGAVITGTGVFAPVGFAINAGVTTEYDFVDLCIS
jgi:hypothetical protein